MLVADCILYVHVILRQIFSQVVLVLLRVYQMAHPDEGTVTDSY